MIDERGVRRATGQRLDAEGAGPGEQVEDPGVVDRTHRPQRVERRLADAVARRPRRVPSGRDEVQPSGRSGDHTHSGNLTSAS
jgi:hypothetical protein